MPDKVKPLKMEDSVSGTEINFAPTETDPTEDYLASKGLALENDDNTLIDKAGDGQVQFTDTTNGTKKVSDLLDAEQEDFDPLTSGLVSTKSGPAIRELAANAAASASPGFSWGKQGNITPNTWLLNEGVASNIAGRWQFLTSATITNVFVANQQSTTFDVSIYYHDGNGSGITLIGTVSVIAAKGDTFAVNWAVPIDKQIAARVTLGSPKNITVGVLLSGTK